MQMRLFDLGAGENQVEPSSNEDVSSTFADNLSLPVHRWFRYSAGFSATWAREVMLRSWADGRRTVLDPFAGSGTIPLESETIGMEGIGLETHPFVARVARAKLLWHANPDALVSLAGRILRAAMQQSSSEADLASYPPLVRRCFPDDILIRLHAMRSALAQAEDEAQLEELCWLALTACLRDCSPVGTAQWQYVLPKKAKRKAQDPYVAFGSRIRQMAVDMRVRQCDQITPGASIVQDDARHCTSILDGWADLVITSPPYANNYDYADATRLEMSFFGEVRGWGDLQERVRRFLIRSCTQHVAPLAVTVESLVEAPGLKPIRDELIEVCAKLRAEREGHGGHKPYDTMIAAYFSDLAQVWQALRRVTSERGLVCWVIGDSAPYGVYVPVDRWLGELALSCGFRSFKFEKTRDRNTKWKNRKHRVPLQEGRLWVER